MSGTPQFPRQGAAVTNLLISQRAVGDACVLAVSGVLRGSTYLPLRDAIVKAALDEPAAVIVDISGLNIRDEPALAVFTGARWQVSEWPDIPIGLVCANEHRLKALRRNAITRYMPVFQSVRAAASGLAADALRRYRRRVRAELPALKSSTARSRQLTAQWLIGWSRTDFTAAASIVATELVELALKETGDTDAPIVLRLETDGSTVTVAVQHQRSAAVVPQAPRGDRLSELDLIAASCRVWGSHAGAAGVTTWVVLGPENRF